MIFDALCERYAWVNPDSFLDLTMRQVVGFMKRINRSKVEELYAQTQSFAVVFNRTLPPLDEVLQSSVPESERSFDPGADKALMDHALKLQQQGRKHG